MDLRGLEPDRYTEIRRPGPGCHSYAIVGDLPCREVSRDDWRRRLDNPLERSSRTTPVDLPLSLGGFGADPAGLERMQIGVILSLPDVCGRLVSLELL